MNIRQILKNRTVNNAGWLIAGRVAQMVINLIIGLLTARYLGPSNFGVINYATAYTTFFAAFCTLGINSVLVKEFIDKPGEEGSIIGTSLGLRAISSFLSVIVIISIVSIIDSSEPQTVIAVALSGIGVLFQIFEVINYWFQSRLKSKVVAISSFIAYFIVAVYKTVLILLHKDVTYFAAATAIDYFFLGLLLLFAYKKNGGKRLSFSKKYGKELLNKSRHFILPSLMVAIYGQTDRIMLKHMISTAEIGYYSTAVSVSNMWCFVLSAIIDSCYPSIMQAYNTSKAVYVKRNKQLYAIIFYMSLVVSILFTLLGKLIIGIMYGQAYLPAVAPLRIVTWYTAFSYLGVARNAWIVCENRQKYLIYIYISSAVANVILNILFIPRWGATGAAVASLIAQIMTTMIVPFFIKGLRENSKMMVEAIMLKGCR